MEDNIKNKDRKISLVVCISVFLVFIGVATYAYFSTSDPVINGFAVDVESTGSQYIFTSVATKNDIDVDASFMKMMQESELYGVADSDYGTIEVSLSSPSNSDTTTCTFDLVWTYDSESDIYSDANNYVPYSGYPYELGVEVLKNNTSQVIHNIDEYGAPVNRKVNLGNYTITSSSTTQTVDTYKINVNIYNIPIHQTNIKNKHYIANINVENVNCLIS